jgi:S1-C subfamily serine protease
LYDRYYSFGKKDPFQLSDRWANPPPDLNMSTPMNFISTNDIIGGNSGSAVVNKDLEVVGLIFDGNIESLPGNIIFMDEKNRSVSVHSAGLVEGIDKIYRAGRIANELRTAKIVEEPKALPVPEPPKK